MYDEKKASQNSAGAVSALALSEELSFCLHEIRHGKQLPCYKSTNKEWLVPITMLQQVCFPEKKLADVERMIENTTNRKLELMNHFEINQMKFWLNNTAAPVEVTFPPLTETEYVCQVSDLENINKRVEELFSDISTKKQNDKSSKSKSGKKQGLTKYHQKNNSKTTNKSSNTIISKGKPILQEITVEVSKGKNKSNDCRFKDKGYQKITKSNQVDNFEKDLVGKTVNSSFKTRIYTEAIKDISPKSTVKSTTGSSTYRKSINMPKSTNHRLDPSSNSTVPLRHTIEDAPNITCFSKTKPVKCSNSLLNQKQLSSPSSSSNSSTLRSVVCVPPVQKAKFSVESYSEHDTNDSLKNNVFSNSSDMNCNSNYTASCFSHVLDELEKKQQKSPCDLKTSENEQFEKVSKKIKTHNPDKEISDFSGSRVACKIKHVKKFKKKFENREKNCTEIIHDYSPKHQLLSRENYPISVCKEENRHRLSNDVSTNLNDFRIVMHKMPQVYKTSYQQQFDSSKKSLEKSEIELTDNEYKKFQYTRSEQFYDSNRNVDFDIEYRKRNSIESSFSKDRQNNCKRSYSPVEQFEEDQLSLARYVSPSRRVQSTDRETSIDIDEPNNVASHFQIKSNHTGRVEKIANFKKFKFPMSRYATNVSRSNFIQKGYLGYHKTSRNFSTYYKKCRSPFIWKNKPHNPVFPKPHFFPVSTRKNIRGINSLHSSLIAKNQRNEQNAIPNRFHNSLPTYFQNSDTNDNSSVNDLISRIRAKNTYQQISSLNSIDNSYNISSDFKTLPLEVVQNMDRNPTTKDESNKLVQSLLPEHIEGDEKPIISTDNLINSDEFVTLDEDWDLDHENDPTASVCLENIDEQTSNEKGEADETVFTWPFRTNFQNWKDIFKNFDLKKFPQSNKKPQTNSVRSKTVQLPFQWKKKLIEKSEMTLNNFVPVNDKGANSTQSVEKIVKLLVEELLNALSKVAPIEKKNSDFTNKYSPAFKQVKASSHSEHLKIAVINSKTFAEGSEEMVNNRNNKIQSSNFNTSNEKISSSGIALEITDKSQNCFFNLDSSKTDKTVSYAHPHSKATTDFNKDGIFAKNIQSTVCNIQRSNQDCDSEKSSTDSFFDTPKNILQEMVAVEENSEKSSDETSSGPEFESIPLRSYANVPLENKKKELEEWKMKDCVVNIEILKLFSELLPNLCQSDLIEEAKSNIENVAYKETIRRIQSTNTTNKPSLVSDLKYFPRPLQKAKKSIRPMKNRFSEKSSSFIKNTNLNSTSDDNNSKTILSHNNNVKFPDTFVDDKENPKQTHNSKQTRKDMHQPSVGSKVCVIQEGSQLKLKQPNPDLDKCANIASRLRSAHLYRQPKRRTQLPSVSSDDEDVVQPSQETSLPLISPTVGREDTNDDEVLLISCKPYLSKCGLEKESKIMRTPNIAQKITNSKHFVNRKGSNASRKRSQRKQKNSMVILAANSTSTKETLPFSTTKLVSDSSNVVQSKPIHTMGEQKLTQNVEKVKSNNDDSKNESTATETRNIRQGFEKVRLNALNKISDQPQNEIDTSVTGSGPSSITLSSKKFSNLRSVSQDSSKTNDIVNNTEMKNSENYDKFSFDEAPEPVVLAKPIKDNTQDPVASTTQSPRLNGFISISSENTNTSTAFESSSFSRTEPHLVYLTNSRNSIVSLNETNLPSRSLNSSKNAAEKMPALVNTTRTEQSDSISHSTSVAAGLHSWHSSSKDALTAMETNSGIVRSKSILSNTNVQMSVNTVSSKNGSIKSFQDAHHTVLSPSAKSVYGETYHHGMMEIHLSAPPSSLISPARKPNIAFTKNKICFAKRRIPYVQLKINKQKTLPAEKKLGNSQFSDESSSGGGNTATSILLIRIRDSAFSLQQDCREHAKHLIHLGVVCYEQNDFTKSVYELIYNKVAQANEVMSVMLGFNRVLSEASLNENSMINLDDYLKVILPNYYYNTFGIMRNYLPEFVSVTTYKSIDIVTPFVVETFSKSYAYNYVFINDDSKPLQNKFVFPSVFQTNNIGQTAKRKSVDNNHAESQSSKTCRFQQPVKQKRTNSKRRPKSSSTGQTISISPTVPSSISYQNSGPAFQNYLQQPLQFQPSIGNFFQAGHIQQNCFPSIPLQPRRSRSFESTLSLKVISPHTENHGETTFCSKAALEPIPTQGLTISHIQFVNGTQASSDNARRNVINKVSQSHSNSSISSLSASPQENCLMTERPKYSLSLGAKFVSDSSNHQTLETTRSVDELQKILQSIRATTVDFSTTTTTMVNANSNNNLSSSGIEAVRNTSLRSSDLNGTIYRPATTYQFPLQNPIANLTGNTDELKTKSNYYTNYNFETTKEKPAQNC